MKYYASEATFYITESNRLDYVPKASRCVREACVRVDASCMPILRREQPQNFELKQNEKQF